MQLANQRFVTDHRRKIDFRQTYKLRKIFSRKQVFDIDMRERLLKNRCALNLIEKIIQVTNILFGERCWALGKARQISLKLGMSCEERSQALECRTRQMAIGNFLACRLNVFERRAEDLGGDSGSVIRGLHQ